MTHTATDHAPPDRQGWLSSLWLVATTDDQLVAAQSRIASTTGAWQGKAKP
ncbi:UNVERIFIED_ORG: hypothetical protein ABIC48_006189 [Burkholderia territorii]